MGSQHNDAASEVTMPTTTGRDMNLDQNSSSSNGPLCDSNIDVQINNVDNANGSIKGTGGIPNLYAEDVVRNKVTNLIGIVTEVAGDLDSDAEITDDDEDDDDGDDDDDDEDENENAEDCENEERDAHDKSKDNLDENEGVDKSAPLSAEEVRILWINGTETAENRSDLTITDRGFLHGDYVAAAADPTGQLGVVVDADITVDLSAADGSSILNISSRELKRVREFTVGDYVVLGPWLGRIDDVLDNVTVKVDDGSVCKVMKADPLRLKPMTKNLLEDGHCPYYPGQRVRATSSSIFKNSRWLSGLWKASKLEGTVMRVTVGSVFVYWIASAGYGPNASTTPAEEQSPKNLKLLSCFAYANWQLGDWCLLQASHQASSVPLHKGFSKLKIDDSVKSEAEAKSSLQGAACDAEEVLDECNETEVMKDSAVPSEVHDAAATASSDYSSCGSSAVEPVQESRQFHRKRIRKIVVKRDKKNRKKDENFERALQIVNTRTKVDVLWQDGKIEHGLHSINLIPIETPGDHDFVAEQYVVEKAADDEDYSGEPRRVGVIRSVNAKERTACVNWLKPVANAEDPREFDREEIVSVYELEGHPDYDYCYGDVVVRLSTVISPRVVSGNSSETSERKSEGNVNMEMSNNEHELSPEEGYEEFADFSWVGNISGLRNGDIEVTWADGMVSTVGPQAIYVVGRDDDDDGSLADGSGLSDVASWETVEDDEMDTHEQDEEDQGLQSSQGVDSSLQNGEDHPGRNSALSLPFAALGFVTRLATGIFSRGRNYDTDSSPEGENHVLSDMIKNSEDSCSGEEASAEKSSALAGADSETFDHVMEKSSSNVADTQESNDISSKSDAPASEVDDVSSFKHFDISRDPFDHYFLGTNAQSNNPRKWFRKVHQDWDILQNNLPDDIYVRVYEDRMDLLRAVIVGAYGTPYQDGLFFFDFHLPPEYPDVPPLAYYHSGGWRINPNLYEEGKVCLSLLNTWTGKGNEVWDPSSSSILQVLVSLQGLVLNAKPYFNEAGYDKQIGTAEGEKNSLSYNENTFLLNCKTMMNLMRRPPKDFGDLINEHFKRRGYYILKACDAYKKGCLIGSLAKDASIVDESQANATSVGFKLMLAKIVPKLLVSLEEVGVDCREFEHLRNS